MSLKVTKATCEGAELLRERREMAVLGAAKHVERHGFSLLSLVDALIDEAMAEVVMDLIADCSELSPDAAKVKQGFRAVLAHLKSIRLSDVEQAARAGRGSRDLDRGLLWHGARLESLLITLEHRS